ncbi:MAG: heavy metal translocating P-type ATPase metal-binding domain-containing protein [Verrucomicrobiales bacterium]|nr:heavy metal translocating P-type ATPase metal-binding domain-containing protein [Verrucomicrobiales bacterium]
MTASTDSTCRHCGTAYPPPAPPAVDGGFCCAGCEFVHGLIGSEGLDQFYDLRGRQTLQPVKSLAFQKRDYDWLAEQVRAAEAVCVPCGEPARLTLDLQGISCAACVWLIERVFRRHAGGLRIVVDAQLGQLRMWWDPGAFDAVAFAEDLQQFGYAVGPASDDAARQAARSETRSLLTRVGIAGGLAMNTMAFTLPRYLGMGEDFFLARLFELITLASASLTMLVGGGYFIRRAWRALAIGALHMDLPIALGLVAAFLGSLVGWLFRIEALMYFDFVATFAFLMLGGRWLQQAAVERNRAALLTDNDRRREVGRLAAGGSVEMVPVAELKTGDRFLAKPGETLPVAARLPGPEGAEFSLEWINGEPEPRALGPGADVPAGSVNVGRAPVAVEAREPFAESLLTRLLEVSERAGHADEMAGSETGRDFSRILRVYLVAVLVAALAGGGWWLAAGAGWPAALQVLISVLVVSCPCALGVALPMLDDLVVARLRRSGLFVQHGSLWPRLKQVRQIVFDKTGTLTREAPRLNNPGALAALSGNDRATLAGLVRDSRHPVGRAIREALGGTAGAGELAGIEETVAQGVSWRDATTGAVWSFGKPGWKAMPDSPADRGASVVFARDDEALAAFHFEEALRDDAVAEVGELRARGYRLAILSGDAPERVREIAGRLGLDPSLAIGGASPQAKADWVRAHEPDHSLYIGDGANDTLAFEAAACRGTPAIGSGVLERQSDFYFLGQGLQAIRQLLLVARRRRTVGARILGVAIAYNIFAVTLALAGWMNPLLAAVLMPFSSVVTLGIAATVKR